MLEISPHFWEGICRTSTCYSGTLEFSPPKPPVTVLPTRQQTIVGPRGRVQRRLSTATNCFRRFLPALGDLQLFNPRR